MKTKHTPTPWACHKGADTVDGYKTFDIHRNNGRCECAEWIATVTSIQSDSETALANAQFICKAVNHHEELVAALIYLRDYVVPIAKFPESARSLLTKLKG